MASLVFLSFSSLDRELALNIYQGLRQRGIPVWKAPESIPPGEDWAAAIHAAITQQNVFLLLWTDAAMASVEVTKEISLAAGKHRRMLLPVRLTSTQPEGAQAYHLAATQWLEGQGLSVPALLDRIEARIREWMETGSQPGKPVALSPRWSAIGKSRRLLQVMVGLLGLSAVTFDLMPWLAPNHWLLDQRLFFQARWRQITAQPGPKPEAIALVQLGSKLYQELGVAPTGGSVNQEALAKILNSLQAGAERKVGLDFILDEPGANAAGHQALAAAIRQQQSQRQIVAGLCPPNSPTSSDCLKAIDQRLAGSLGAAGAESVSLGVGLNSEDQSPLQLIEPVGEGSFAQAMAAAAPRGGLPDEAVIDWSVNWLAPERLVVINDLHTLLQYRGQRLIIASDGYKGRKLNQPADQHPAPQALWAYARQGPERFAALQGGALPGGALQAVMAQSISAGHWLLPLMPFLHTLSSAALAMAAWWAGGLGLRRRWLVLGMAGAAFAYCLFALQLVVVLQRLLPVVIPLAVGVGIIGIKRMHDARC